VTIILKTSVEPTMTSPKLTPMWIHPIGTRQFRLQIRGVMSFDQARAWVSTGSIARRPNTVRLGATLPVYSPIMTNQPMVARLAPSNTTLPPKSLNVPVEAPNFTAVPNAHRLLPGRMSSRPVAPGLSRRIGTR